MGLMDFIDMLMASIRQMEYLSFINMHKTVAFGLVFSAYVLDKLCIMHSLLLAHAYGV